jgi:VanZ family protein
VSRPISKNIPNSGSRNRTRFRNIRPAFSTIRRGLSIVLAGYWLALFVSTHLPKIPKPLQLDVSDKWQHYAAFSLLSILLTARWSFGRALTRAMALKVVGTIALYAIFDELTQIPVGRKFEVYDCLADLVGALSGLAAFALVRTVFGRAA